ncbi:hypothetical protein FNYG_15520 [Fusarium nygamai]|uniref:Prion-inhibition and propagation HeLo domain-containing protein n=1 Tax=Gibberella nygamai TaxID=42673 RepID=A0A2K0UC97_GIBNY|nr:hypothetical protein FNYG_15520 [Fusarium nygamai]
MEAAGLAFGVIPIAIELFNQSVAAYKLFIEGKELEKTAAHMGARLAIEERRLVQWGEGSGLHSDSKPEIPSDAFGLDSRLLQNKALCDVVIRTLTCIKDVLYDTDSLSKKYGMKISSMDIPKDAEKGVVTEDIKVDEKAPLHSPKSSVSRLSRFKWAIKDKDKFSELLEQLKYYNDSLYSLLPREIGVTITRDVLAFLVASASDNSLLQFRSLGRKEERLASPGGANRYGGISSAASIALKIRHQTMKEDAITVIPKSEIHPDSEGSRLATWKKPGEDARVFLEAKQTVRSEAQGDGFGGVRLLASLLNRTSTAREFSALRCLGISHMSSEAPTLIYDLPDDANPIAEPATLYEMLTDGSGWVPTLDDRFELAKVIAGAIFQMHSAGWMHKDVSSHNILFFKHTAKDRDKGLYNVNRPYLKGFRFSRRVYIPSSDSDFEMVSYRSKRRGGGGNREGGFFGDNHQLKSHAMRRSYEPSMGQTKFKRKEHENTELLREAIYQHPAYVFHKLISEATSNGYSELSDYKEHNKKETYFTCRHEYYSLGLLLLEIGLWRPIETMDFLTTPVAATGIWDFPLSLSLTYDHGVWEERNFNGRIMTATKTIRAARYRLLSSRDENIWPAELQSYVQELRQVLGEERIEGISLKVCNAASPDNVESFWSLWDEVYPHVILRKDAVGLSKRAIGLQMGRRYRDVIIRCLNSDLSIPPASDEFKWLRAFNWLIVKELDKCCV